ncbi:regulator of G-protein signaling 21-like [Cyprinus carpio]|uniref:Regulator of G-protein signaling 21-like n=1 Tax=Cyprinus carpio TaxID=7962 RepID=A0A9Q9ZHJ4_CYPCA|nr:regulator of G-protein signaling 21-like [Cyprinus carpio]
MPKMLFSKIRIYEFKDLIRNNKQLKTLQNHEPKLSDLLENRDYLDAFRSFLQSEFSVENIEFWLACREYKRMTSSGKLSNKAADIYKEFLHPKAQKEVNIDHHTREKIKRSLIKPDLTCFDEAEMHIYRLMEEDSCPRFLKSEAYQNLRNAATNPMQTSQ